MKHFAKTIVFSMLLLAVLTTLFGCGEINFDEYIKNRNSSAQTTDVTVTDASSIANAGANTETGWGVIHPVG